MFRSHILLLIVTVCLAGCSSGEARLESSVMKAEMAMINLRAALDSGSVRNASLIREYARLLSSSKPELAPLLTELQKEATVSGPLFTGLRERFEGARDGSQNYPDWLARVSELDSVAEAASLPMFNDALSDTVNVIADMSDGQLARVNAVSREAEQMMNNAGDFGAGSQYIGNPHYGYWNQGSGGSFWVWYGQYRLFSDLFGGNRYYYRDWAPRRGYSYYHDVGRNSFSSRSQRAGLADVDNRARKQFGSGGRFQSPYAKSRTGASGLSQSSRARQTSMFKSQYSKTASASNFGSSTRNSAFRTSRGLSGGK